MTAYPTECIMGRTWALDAADLTWRPVHHAVSPALGGPMGGAPKLAQQFKPSILCPQHSCYFPFAGPVTFINLAAVSLPLLLFLACMNLGACPRPLSITTVTPSLGIKELPRPGVGSVIDSLFPALSRSLAHLRSVALLTGALVLGSVLPVHQSHSPGHAADHQ